MYVCMYVCMHVCMHACMYVHTILHVLVYTVLCAVFCYLECHSTYPIVCVCSKFDLNFKHFQIKFIKKSSMQPNCLKNVKQV